MWPEELMGAIDEHDALIRACALGKIGVRDFLTAYDGFYHRAALDGHEGGAATLDRLADRIEIHRLIWDRVERHITAEEHAGDPDHAAKGFIGEREGLTRIREIARQGGLLGES